MDKDSKQRAMVMVLNPEGITGDMERKSDDVDQDEMKCPKCGHMGPRETFERG